MCNAACRKSTHTKCTCSCQGRYHGTESESLFTVPEKSDRPKIEIPKFGGCSACARFKECDCLDVDGQSEGRV